MRRLYHELARPADARPRLADSPLDVRLSRELVRLPARVSRGHVIVELHLDGHGPARFLLDTGATWCGVTSQMAARLRLNQHGQNVRMQTAGGIVPMPAV